MNLLVIDYIIMSIRICPWAFGHDLCLGNARRPPLEPSQSDGFVRVSPIVVPDGDKFMCTQSNRESDFARAGLRESDLGISMRRVKSMSHDIVVF